MRSRSRGGGAKLESRFHSVKLLEDKCKGCTNCIKRCPTEAIRVREGKAVINAARCIDCGECVRTCENHAKAIIANSLEDLKEFDYNIALPAPALYSQIGKASGPDEVVWALKCIGFDAVCDVSFGADIITECTRRYIRRTPQPRPLISSACPAVVRLVQVRFPGLIPHLARMESPMYAAARIARARIGAELGIPDDRIGVFFISPCAAKVTAVISPLGSEKSYVNGALAVSDIYGQLMANLGCGGSARPIFRGSGFGFGWAVDDGELRALGGDVKALAVDGIHNVIGVLEEADSGRLQRVDYIEALACQTGCVGGPANVENPFVARVRMQNVSAGINSEALRDARSVALDIIEEFGEDAFGMHELIQPLAGMELAECLESAIARMGELEKIVAELPGLDCGACGSPTCRTHAEDVVCGQASETDCVFKLRERMQRMAEDLLRLARMDLPSMARRDDK